MVTTKVQNNYQIFNVFIKTLIFLQCSIMNSKTMNKNRSNVIRKYTIEEIDAILNEAEKDFEMGNHLTNDEVFHPKHQ